LETLAREEIPAQVAKLMGAEGTFDHRCSQAFQALGFEIKQGPHGPSWRIRVTAVTPHGTYGVILNPQTRRGDYVLPVDDDPELYDQISAQAAHLTFAGIPKAYLACIGPSFRETGLAGLVRYFASSGFSGITLFSAAALMRTVEASIRDRATFTLAKFEETLAGNSLIV
jgi:hypothetical protein